MRDDTPADGTKSDIVLQTSDTTWQAYNGWAGNNGQVGANFYGDASGTIDHDGRRQTPALATQDRAYAVSYNRPFITRDGTSPASGAQDYLFGADYAAIYWLEKNGYDVSYISGVDTDRLGADNLIGHKAYISVGHDEYWSGDQRANVEAARDAGVNLLFWSGNEVYWKTRYEPSIDGSNTDYRTLVSYKETWANRNPNAAPADYANIDPSNEWTGTWRDLRFVDSVDANGTHTAVGPDAGERAHRPAVRPRRHRRAGRRARHSRVLRRPARLARHLRCRNGDARYRARHPRLRVGHLAGGPISSGRPDQALRDDHSLERHPGRPGQPGAAGDRDPQPFALSRRRKRRSGLRRRHGVLELGAQQRARQLALRRQHRECGDPAVHGQHVRRHGHPAGGGGRHPRLAGAGARDRLHRHDSRHDDAMDLAGQRRRASRP